MPSWTWHSPGFSESRTFGRISSRTRIEIASLGMELKEDKDTLAALRKRLSDPQVKVREAATAAIRRIEKKPEKPHEKKP